MFSILVQTTPISPDVINLSTGADPSCLPLQNQTTKEEDKAAGKAVLCLRLWVCSIKGLQVFVEFFCILLRPLNWATATSGPRPPRYLTITITLRHAQSVGLFWTSDRSTHRPLTTRNTHKRHISYSSDEIRTRDPSKRAAADPHFSAATETDLLLSLTFQNKQYVRLSHEVFCRGRPSPTAPLSKLFLTKCKVLPRFHSSFYQIW